MIDSRVPRLLHLAETITGGVTTYLNEIMAAQAAAFGTDNVRILVPDGQADELVAVDPRMIVTYPRTGRDTRSLISFCSAAQRALRDFQPSIVHVHSSFAGALARPMLALTRPRPRVVYCAHGWSFLMDVPRHKRQIYAILERALCRLTDVVINISNHEHQQAQLYGIDADKCVVVRNAISRSSATKGDVARMFDDACINLLFVGRFDRQKGLDLLLAVMKRLQGAPIRLHVIGACVNEDRSEQAVGNVNILGWLPRHAIDRYYAAADAVVMPSRWEGFGLVAIEAMRNSTAVIVSNRGALPELVEDGKTGYVFDLDEGDLGNLERLLRGLDKTRLAQMGKAARQHFSRNFTADAMNRSLIEIYAALHQRPLSAGTVLQLSRSNS